MKYKELQPGFDQSKDLSIANTSGTTQFYNVPSSNIVKSSLSALGGIRNFGEIGTVKNPKSRAFLIYDDEGSTQERKIIKAYKREDLKFSIAYCDFTKMFQKDNNKGLMKIYVFILTKIYDQCFYQGKFIDAPDIKPIVEIRYSQMVEAGMYQSETAARDNFKSNLKKLKSMEFSSELMSKKDGKAFIPLFKGEIPVKGGYNLVLNDLIDWNAIAEFYTKVPKWAFKLSSRAFSVMFYVFYLARQNVKNINDNHYFTIKPRSIQIFLNLPDEKETTDPKRVIKEPIKDAIDEINKEAAPNSFNIELEPKAINRKIKDFLDNSTITVHLNNEYSDAFSSLKKAITKQKKK